MRHAPGGCPGRHGGCGERSGGCERRARSSLLRRAFRHASSVVAALAALAPRLVRLAHHGDPGSLLALLLLLAGSARAAEEATVALNFQDVELPVLARFVSEVTGRNFIVDDRVRGRVTIISPTRITPDEAYLVFQSVLQVKGFTTVPSGAFTKIVPAREALASGARRGDEVVTRILPLRHADASSLVPVLQPLVSKDGLLTAYPPSNSLVVVDAGANVDRLAGLLADLDVPSSERATEVVALRFAPAEETARRLRDGVGGQALRVTADARTNALVLSGPPDEVRRARA
ncbi:MAG TPA: secretin N-terminal domain-containing protein, partial [Candidatus Limnocylindria bacterium]|nr:secretin N-terminal domain-containing protein [Candidatus Limnocylindria bacterium]